MTWSELRRRFVERVYAAHNDTPHIRDAVQRCRDRVSPLDWSLNLGSGYTQRRSRTVNFDCVSTPTVDYLGFAHRLPFRTGAFKLVITQETLEHVRDPASTLDEIHRVLASDGMLYCQLPFIIGYHPGPTDFWRFTREGIEALVTRAGFRCDEIEVAVGPATGFYRVAVEFTAVVASGVFSKLYFPAKAAAALVFAPIKVLDRPLAKTPQVDRLAGGYYVIARKSLSP